MAIPSVRALLAAATANLADSADNPRLEAELLLAHALGWPRTRLLTRDREVPEASERQRFDGLVAERRRGVPIAYLTGTREFWSLTLEVTPATLIPRPETERLVELALARLPADAVATVADLGTGSGAIALALASERPRWSLLACDRSLAALVIAQRNARRLALANVQTVAADWCTPLAPGRLAMIVSNPPYVAAGDPYLARGDLRFEPRQALTAGNDALEAVRRVAAGARDTLVAGGHLLVEHGHDQCRQVCRLFEEHGFIEVATYDDLAGVPRVTAGRLPGNRLG